MKKILNKFKDGIFIGVGIILVFGITHAWVNLGTVLTGDTLTEIVWNNMVTKLNETGNRVSGIFTDAGGNVGIGTSAPTSKLDVVGATNTTEITGPWDNSDNGYIRLGDVQIAWGKTSSSTWPKAVVFPIAFITPPVVTADNPRSSYYTTNGSSNIGPTTTGFNCYVTSNAGVTLTAIADCHWIAIGKWR